LIHLNILWGGSFDPLRRHQSGYFSDWYDAQARALLHGHWWAPKGSFSFEAFVVNGREYMYFGPFPAFLRMPLLLFTDRYYGQLTATSMLLAWLVAAVFASLLLWRMRIVVRGDAPLTRAECVGAALFLASVMVGSPVVYLASQPMVYTEAIAWGFAWTLGSLFTLLGVIERPSTHRLVALGGCLTATVLSRATLGWGCIAAAAGLGLWSILRNRRPLDRRQGVATLAVACLALSAGMYVTWARFGNPFFQPLDKQAYLVDNPVRRAFLAANDNALAGPQFVPSTVLTYFRPDGVGISSLFPFVTAPQHPPRIIHGAVFDGASRTPSIPASSTLLFLLMCVGSYLIALRRSWSSLRFPLLAAAIGACELLVFGSIAPRYLSDFIPLLCIAGGAALLALFGAVAGNPSRRRWLLGAIGVLAAWGIVANFGIATENEGLASEGPELRQYVDRRADVADIMHQEYPVHVAAEVPPWAPPGTLYASESCDALYVATGELRSSPWLAVERGPNANLHLEVNYRAVEQGIVPLVTTGSTTLSVEDAGIDWYRMMRLRLDGPLGTQVTPWTPMNPGDPRAVDITLDVPLRRLRVSLDGGPAFEGFYDGLGEPVVSSRDAPGPQEPQVVVRRLPTPDATLCRSLAHTTG